MFLEKFCDLVKSFSLELFSMLFTRPHEGSDNDFNERILLIMEHSLFKPSEACICTEERFSSLRRKQ